MPPIWLRTTYSAVEFGVSIVLLALSGLIISDAIRLGPGWGEQGPQPGFFPFVLAICVLIGAIGVLWINIAKPDRRPFFDVPQEVEDLLKVGAPVLVAGAIIPWTGLYISAGLYIAFFMAWYGKFRWYAALAGGVLLPAALWMTLREGFNIAMPMSMFYRTGVLPF